ncbi:hypothetical protein CALVIDRAFT_531604 [Calocera viscosa TUFC12733]|uniref:Uncharacterized protein n=1 Tax=Calocera viscosa (strain TUFC12733) TaxID=1330018 RepID=A0A167G6M2_CALVF|nr:hypothetical protein CALVIDRAFT_531604 [Calocera viscosa TUFC12733]
MDEERAAKAARAKALLKQRQKKKKVDATETSTEPASSRTSMDVQREDGSSVHPSSNPQSVKTATSTPVTSPPSTPSIPPVMLSQSHKGTPSKRSPAAAVSSPPAAGPPSGTNGVISPELGSVDALKEKVQTQQQTIALLVNEKTSLTASLEAEASEAKTRADELEERVQQLEAEVKAEQARVHEAMGQGKKEKERGTDLEREIERNKRAAADFQAQVVQKNERIRSLEQQLQADDRIETLEKSLQSAQNRVETLETQLAHTKVKAERDDFEEQLDTLQKSERAARQALDVLKDDHSKATDQLASVATERDSHLSIREDLEAKVPRLEKALKDVQESLDKALTTSSSTEKQLHASETELNSVLKRANDLQAENEQILSSLEELRPKVVELNNEKIELGDRLDEMAKQLRERDGVIAQLENNLEEARASAEAEGAKLRQALADAHKHHSSKEKELSDLVKTHDELQRELESALASAKELEADRTALRKNMITAQEQVDRFKTGTEARVSEHASIQRELDDYKRRLEELEVESNQSIQELEEALRSAQTEAETLRAEVSKLRTVPGTPVSGMDNDVPQTPANKSSLEDEMLHSMEQQHLLDLSSARSQIRSLETQLHEEQSRMHTLTRRVQELELSQTRSPPTANSHLTPLGSGSSPSFVRPALPTSASYTSLPPPARSGSFLRPSLEADVPEYQRHKRRISLSMLKARMDSEVVAIPLPSTEGEDKPVEVHVRSQFGDESHIFWCSHCRGDVLIL